MYTALPEDVSDIVNPTTKKKKKDEEDPACEIVYRSGRGYTYKGAVPMCFKNGDHSAYYVICEVRVLPQLTRESFKITYPKSVLPLPSFAESNDDLKAWAKRHTKHVVRADAFKPNDLINYQIEMVSASEASIVLNSIWSIESDAEEEGGDGENEEDEEASVSDEEEEEEGGGEESEESGEDEEEEDEESDSEESMGSPRANIRDAQFLEHSNLTEALRSKMGLDDKLSPGEILEVLNKDWRLQKDAKRK
ncbi:hypothetical protein FOA52_012812 [Chlamydomonas sp. UWO 241]|nr:hypothetical protein FOA52_012812 [Chlamydomonas sp. UWO 241]